MAFSCDVVPLGEDDVGEQEKIEDERRAVHSRAEWSIQWTGVSCHVRELPRRRCRDRHLALLLGPDHEL